MSVVARDYAVSEGYPDLVVHGPLLALAMLELPRRYAPDRRVTRFAYRLRAPLSAPHEVVVTGTAGDGSAELRVGAAATGNADLV